MVWGSAVSSPSWVWGGAPAANAFVGHFEPRKRAWWQQNCSFCSSVGPEFYTKTVPSLSRGWGREFPPPGSFMRQSASFPRPLSRRPWRVCCSRLRALRKQLETFLCCKSFPLCSLSFSSSALTTWFPRLLLLLLSISVFTWPCPDLRTADSLNIIR